MDEPVLKIRPKQYNEKKTIISVRLAKDLVDDLDAVAGMTGRNRNDILTMSLEFALAHMQIVIKENDEKLIDIEKGKKVWL